MNYRHAYHAGNFADLVKHALLLALLDALQTDTAPLTVIDTHAGGGLYDLSDGTQARSKEAEAGVARLMATDRPAELEGLAHAVARRNPDGRVRFYPGSPSLIAERLRRGDRYVACELRDEEHARLAGVLAGALGATAVHADGYVQVVAEARRAARLLILIDPPFEQADDYVRCAETAAAVLKANPKAVVTIWTPIKDMETFDGFLRRLSAAGVEGALVAEARLRPLVNPMRMNGCAMVTINAPAGLAATAGAVCGWVARELGEPGGRAEVWTA